MATSNLAPISKCAKLLTKSTLDITLTHIYFTHATHHNDRQCCCCACYLYFAPECIYFVDASNLSNHQINNCQFILIHWFGSVTRGHRISHNINLFCVIYLHKCQIQVFYCCYFSYFAFGRVCVCCCCCWLSRRFLHKFGVRPPENQVKESERSRDWDDFRHSRHSITKCLLNIDRCTESVVEWGGCAQRIPLKFWYIHFPLIECILGDH